MEARRFADAASKLVQRPCWVGYILRNKNETDDTELTATREKDLILKIYKVTKKIMAANLNFLKLQSRGWWMTPKRFEGFSFDRNLDTNSQTKNSI